MTYAELEQRRTAIEEHLALSVGARERQYAICIRALLDDADCGELPTHSPGPAHYGEALAAYDRALSIAEKELGL